MLQGAATALSSPLDLVRHAGPETKVVLAIMAILSIVSWYLIISKWWQQRQVRGQKKRFFWELERSEGLAEAYHAAMKLPPSPSTRVLREGVAFYTNLRPGGLKPAAIRRAIRAVARGAQTLNSSSSRDTIASQLPGSPCRPQRPKSWRSTRRDS